MQISEENCGSKNMAGEVPGAYYYLKSLFSLWAWSLPLFKLR